MQPRVLLCGLALASAGVMSCYPGEFINSVPQLASVLTVVDSQPLKTARTFAILDSIGFAGKRDGSLTVGRVDATRIVGRIRSELIAHGWSEVDYHLQRPDVVVLAAVFIQQNNGVAYANWWGDYAYWGGWPAGVGSSWAWGVPGAEITFTFDTGTLLITMLDLRNRDPERQRIPLIWAAAINGVVALNVVDRALAGISQAFLQSPYLERP